MASMKLSGVLAPIPTPFDHNGQLDTGRLQQSLRRWMTSPLHGVVVLGSNGEAALLDEDESDRAVGAAREVVPRDRVLLAGVGRESTAATVHAARRAAALGADAVLVRTPGFFKSQMTADVFVRHYTTVADHTPVPVYLYNFTAVTGVDLPPAAVARLALHPNIVGMKESGGDVGRIAELVDRTPADFQVLAGSATTFYPSLVMGAVGGILALSCVVPDACVKLFDLTRQGRHQDARALQRRLVPLGRLLGSVHGVPGLKAALTLLGHDVGSPRPPLMPLSETGITELREALSAFKGVPS
jgi:4-hydroxy-2-oxoglutarate aldolase